MHMKTFILILKRILSEKCPDVEIDFYLASRSKNVHMGLNCNILTLSEHVHIISDIEKIWNEKRQNNKFVFVMPYLIHTTRSKNDYIVFKKCLMCSKDVLVLLMFLRELIRIMHDMMFGLLKK